MRDRRRPERARRRQGAGRGAACISTASRSRTGSAATGCSGTGTASRGYRSLHINTSRDRGWPTPTSRCRPTIPTSRTTRSWRAISSLCRRLRPAPADHFGTAVMRAEREEPGALAAHARHGRAAATTPWSSPTAITGTPAGRSRRLPGPFAGEIIHAHDYVGPTSRSTLPASGWLSSAWATAPWTSPASCPARHCRAALSVGAARSLGRAQVHLGRPMDRLGVGAAWLPWRVRSLTARAADPAGGRRALAFGLPRPDHPPLAAPPDRSARTSSSRLGRGDVVPKPEIRGSQGRTRAVRRRQHGRGRRHHLLHRLQGELPVLRPGVPGGARQRPAVLRRLCPPGEADLFFVGLLQPLGAVMPIAEAQAKLVATCSRPTTAADEPSDAAEMERDAPARRAATLPRPAHDAGGLRPLPGGLGARACAPASAAPSSAGDRAPRHHHHAPRPRARPCRPPCRRWRR